MRAARLGPPPPRRCRPCADDDEDLDEELLGGIVLPPMPVPDLKQMRSEAAGGCSFVICVVITCVGVTVGTTRALPESMHASLIVTLVIVEALVALCCLAYLMWGDPGVIPRNRHTVLPIPTAVAEKLAAAAAAPGGEAMHPLMGLQNIRDGDRSYCVRCCVWRDEVETLPVGWIASLCRPQSCQRPRRVKVHHCSTCQRCVRHFDHHCGVRAEDARNARAAGPRVCAF